MTLPRSVISRLGRMGAKAGFSGVQLDLPVAQTQALDGRLVLDQRHDHGARVGARLAAHDDDVTRQDAGPDHALAPDPQRKKLVAGPAGRHRDVAFRVFQVFRVFRGRRQAPRLHAPQDRRPARGARRCAVFEQAIAAGLAAGGQQPAVGHQFFEMIAGGLRGAEAEDLLDVAHRRGIAGQQPVADELEDPLTGLTLE